MAKHKRRPRQARPPSIDNNDINGYSPVRLQKPARCSPEQREGKLSRFSRWANTNFTLSE